MSNARIVSVAPMLNVADINAEVTLFRDVLGFTDLMGEGGYSVMHRDGTEIHIAENHDEEVLSHVKGRMQIYVQTDDIALDFLIKNSGALIFLGIVFLRERKFFRSLMDKKS